MANFFRWISGKPADRDEVRDAFFNVQQGAPKATVVVLEGVISGPQPGIPDEMLISAKEVETLMLAALAEADKNGGRVVIDLKTPGGSAIESNLIGQAIRGLRKQYPDVEVDAFISGMCASGGNMIIGMEGVVDNVYASPGAVMGSVGVVSEDWDISGIVEKKGGLVRQAIAGAQKRDQTYAEGSASNQQELQELHRSFKDMMIEKFGDSILENPDAVRDIAYKLKIRTGTADALGRRQIKMMRSQLSEAESGDFLIDFDSFEKRLRDSEDPKYSDAQIAHMLADRLIQCPIPHIQSIGRQAVKMTDKFNVSSEDRVGIEAEARQYADNLVVSKDNWAEIEDILFNGGTWTSEEAKALGIVDEIYDSAADMLYELHGIKARRTHTVSAEDLRAWKEYDPAGAQPT